MTTQTYDRNGVSQEEVIYNIANTATSEYEKILTPEELDSSRLMNVRFYTAKHQVPNDFVTTKDKDGSVTLEPIYDDEERAYKTFEMIRIETIGSSGIPTVVEAFVNDFHKMRFHDRYAAFKAGKEGKVEGALIEELKGIPRSAIAALNEAGFHTIEQLAKTSTPNVVPNGATYQKIAKAALAKAGDTKTNKIEAEAAAMKEELEAMKAQLAELLKANK